MAGAMLRVRARAGLVTRYDLIDQGVMRKVGMRLLPHPEAANGFAWVPTGETESVPDMKEFRDEVRDGGLWAADEDTARRVFGEAWKSNFDPSFGGSVTANAEEKA